MKGRSSSAGWILRAGAVVVVVAGLANWHVGPGGPNVLLIVVDTMRADHLGAYGYPRPTSPTLDALATRGMRFARAYSTSSWTGASVASILTGLYPDTHGLERHNSILSKDVPLVSEAFHEAGYDTGAISANPAFVTPELGFGKGFGEFQLLHKGATTADAPEDHVWENSKSTKLVAVATAERVTDAALEWIRRRRGTPFFLYVHYFDPHASYFPPPEYARKFGVAPDDPIAGPLQRIATVGAVPTDPSQLAKVVALYDGEIAFTDAEIGRLIAGLDSLIASPTITMVTADHGEEFGDHGGMQHGSTLFEEQIHVPLIVADHPPGTAPLIPGTTIETAFSLVDVWPLLAGLTGIASSPGKPPITPAAIAMMPDSPVFADLQTNRKRHRWAMVTDPWKLIVQHDQTPLLYELRTDPRERSDRSADDTERTRSLQAGLEARNAACAEARVGGSPAKTVELTEERSERLRALGYLQ
jgi:arylsulfatase A-like enzyme